VETVSGTSGAQRGPVRFGSGHGRSVLRSRGERKGSARDEEMFAGSGRGDGRGREIALNLPKRGKKNEYENKKQLRNGEKAWVGDKSLCKKEEATIKNVGSKGGSKIQGSSRACS